MNPVRSLIISVVVFLYVVSAATRVPDSDYESYIDFFEGGEALSGCYFEPGFCYMVSLSESLGLSATFAYGLFYGLLLLVLLIKYAKYARSNVQSVVALLVIILFIGLINNYYMAFHLYRQNISVLIYSILVLINPVIAFLVAGLFHASVISVVPVYILIRKIDFSKVSAKTWLLASCLLGYGLSFILGQSLEIFSGLNISFIASRSAIYSEYVPSDGVNTLPLLAYALLVFLLANNFSGRGLRVFDRLFYTFVAAIVMACLTSFNELLSYRFFVVAKIISLPILLITLPNYISMYFSRTKQVRIHKILQLN